jgi:cell division protein FtsN
VKTAGVLSIIGIIGFFGNGCGTSDQAQLPPPPPVPEVKEEAPAHVEFRTRTDTVAVVHSTTPDSSAPAGGGVALRYMVQIGAFKDPQLATAVQAAARQRYQLPVLNDYNPLVGLYQIRIGSFSSREAATEFKNQMQREFPTEYKDSWIVQLKQ